ncbi:claudin-8 [Clupea harengus]|uniref:Claudin-8 n=1 Tax=Clupea harengus TaxID=7950 RepID=A0A6P8FP97_CLUHA|nr:claudin-8 [Clupea harengus]
MANGGLEIGALCLTLIGLIGCGASTGMPQWRVTAFIGENIIVMESRYEGLWMNCFRQADIRMQCKVYDSLLALSPDLQAARGLMCCAVALGGLGLLVSIMGMQCTGCIRDNDSAKRMVLIVAGSMVICSGICCIIPVSWTGHAIIRDFYNPLLLDAQRRELGEALYIGWVAGAFLFAGGCVFLCTSAPRDDEDPRKPQYQWSGPPMSYTPQPLLPAALVPRQQSMYSYPSQQPSVQYSRQPSVEYSRQPPVQFSTQPSMQFSRQPSVQYPKQHPVQFSRQPSFQQSSQSSMQPSRQPSLQPVRYPSIHSKVAYL